MLQKIRLSLLISATFLVFATIPLLLQTISSSEITKESILSAEGFRFEQLATNTIYEIDRMLYSRKLDLEELAKAAEMQEAETDDSEGKLSNTLKQWKEKYGIYSAIYFIKDGGRVIAASSREAVGQTVINEAWYKTATDPNLFSYGIVSPEGIKSSANIGPLEYDSLSGGYGINFSIPIYSEKRNRRIGLLISRLNWSELAQLLNKVTVTPKGQTADSYALLLDKQGYVIAGPGSLLTAGQNEDEIIFSNNLLKENNPAAKAALSGDNGYLNAELIGKKNFLIGYAASKGYLDFAGLGWAVLIAEDSEKTMLAATQINSFAWQLVAIIIFTAFALTIFFNKAIAQQIRSLKRTLDSLGKGYFSERTTLVGSSELALLGSTLNDAAQKIETLVKQERKRRESAENSNRAKGEFLAEIGNEFRTPLASIIEMSEALLETNLTEDQRAFTRSMRKSACQVLALANDVRDISRIETGQGNLDASSFDLRNLIEEVAELLAATGQHMGVEISVYYDSTAPHLLLGDAVRMHQIFTNLMAYALRTVQNEQLLISIHGEMINDQESHLQIIVEESGLGLDGDHLRHLLRESETTEKNRSPEEIEDATGELATSKRLIELMGGRLVNVVTEGGTTLYLSIIMRHDQASTTGEIEVDLTNKSIVVATGIKLLDAVITKYLTESGASCVTSPISKLRENLSQGIQLVTTSNVLSDDKTFELIKSAAAKDKLPILSLATLSEQLSESKKAQLPKVNEITRPVRKIELLKAIQ